jgi:formylglycine-generating enzyme required for sulfatase activity
MKKRTLILIALLIFIPTLLLFLVTVLVQPLLPQPWNSALILLGVVLAAVLAGLSGVHKAIQIAYLIDRPEEAVEKEPKNVAEASSGGVSIIADGNVMLVTQNLWKQFPRLSVPQDTLQAATSRYLEHLIQRFQYLNLRGMGISDRIPLRLPLMEMYVPLKARIELPEGETWARQLKLAGRQVSEDEAETMGQRLSEPQPVLDLLRKNDGLIVLGDPGAGKTTFLKYLALSLARGESEALGMSQRLPVLLPLSAYANALADRDVPLSDFLADYYHSQGSDLPVGAMLNEALEQGGALLLLDGLDEVRNLQQRHVVIDRVVNFFNFQRGRGNKFIITSRIVGYREVRPPATDGLAECTLVDFDTEEINLFVEKWTSAIERAAQGETTVAQAEAEREKAELLDTVARNQGVRRLASNPLLLTILALMKRQGVSLPERRVELYDQYVRVLLKHWNLARGLDRPPARDLDVVETVRVLAPLALWMHESSPGVGLVKREDMRRQLASIFAARGHEEPEKATQQFLLDAHEYAGLLVERGHGTFGFNHLTFQEYLAAVAIGQLGQRSVTPIVDVLAAHVGDDNWHEVTLLTIGYIGIVQQRDEAAGETLFELIEAEPGEAGEAAVLAGEAVVDTWPGGVTQQCKTKVMQMLTATMQDDTVVKPLQRAAAGEALGRLGDPRDGVCELEPVLIQIPAGSFLMGEEKYTVAIKEPFAIARYPVTHYQYDLFIQDGGYTEKWCDCWTKDGWKWREGRESQTPWLWIDPDYALPNQPVVGVSWYEAVAYSEWLKRTTGKSYRLPTEAEWERAARHTDGRAFPWGDVWDANRANSKETGWDRPTVVGCFPGGNADCGAADMIGNVWEWCQTRWRDEKQQEYPQPYQFDDDRELLKGGDRVGRVVKGGGWFNDGLRCAYRFRSYPYYDLNKLGFRLVVSPFFSGR